MNDTEDSPWYRDGLRFECTRCGACCTGAPGYVWVEIAEMERLAGFLKLTLDEFGSRYLRQVGDRLSLIETREYSCIFWDSTAGCRVYEARPDQCRTWPFWQSNLASPDAWSSTQAVCPGAGNGALVPLESLQASARRSPC